MNLTAMDFIGQIMDGSNPSDVVNALLETDIQINPKMMKKQKMYQNILDTLNRALEMGPQHRDPPKSGSEARARSLDKTASIYKTAIKYSEKG